MQTTFAATRTRNTSLSLTSRLFAWADGQERNRFGWVAFILALHGCVITPVVILIVALAGMNMALFMTAMCAMCLCLVTNLAAMPTKITIPVFLLSTLVDIVVLAVCVYLLMA